MLDTENMLAIGRQLSEIIYKQDTASIRRHNLQKRRYEALISGNTTAVAEMDALIADNYTSTLDLRIAFEIAGGADPARLDRNGRTIGSDPVRLPKANGDSRFWATDRQIVADEYAGLSVPAARAA